MHQDPGAEQPLPARGAFVVQFSTATDAVRGQFVGRIEHVVSGQATHFLTLEACLAFVGRVLADVRGQPAADVVTVVFRGTVTQAEGTASSVAPGVPFVGKYQIDTSTPNTSTAGDIGVYQHAVPPHVLELNVGTLHFSAVAPSYVIAVGNNLIAPAVDLYEIQGQDSSGAFFGFQLVDPTNTAVNSIALLAAAPVASRWSERRMEVRGFDPSQPGSGLYIVVTSFFDD